MSEPIAEVLAGHDYAAKKYNDYVQISFTATQQRYVIGTNANAARTKSWPSGALAKEIQFYATQACWVRFNYADAVAEYIPAGLPLRFFGSVSEFYVYRDTADGILHAWIEG